MWLSSDHTVYDVVSETTYELEVHSSTPEICIGIGYTPDDFFAVYNNGNTHVQDLLDCLREDNIDICAIEYGTWSERKWYVLFVPNIISSVKSQLSITGRKTASVGLSEQATNQIHYLNKTFKVHGFMYSPSKGCFVPWKEKVVKEKVKKPRVMKGVMNKMKTCVLNTSLKLICDEGDVGFNSDIYCRFTGKIILVVFKLGYTINDILNYNKKGYISNTVYLEEGQTLRDVMNQFIPEIDREVSWNALHEWINEINLTK